MSYEYAPRDSSELGSIDTGVVIEVQIPKNLVHIPREGTCVWIVSGNLDFFVNKNYLTSL